LFEDNNINPESLHIGLLDFERLPELQLSVNNEEYKTVSTSRKRPKEEQKCRERTHCKQQDINFKT
jgi:hypothetical protein